MRPAVSLAHILALLLTAGRSAAAQRIIDGARHHLGTPGDPEWAELDAGPAEGRELVLTFEAVASARLATLVVRQSDVRLEWDVRLNDRRIGRLLPSDADLWNALDVPPGVLRDGKNILTIGPPSGRGDVMVGEVALDLRPRADALGGAVLDVRVKDRASTRGIPCRITVVDDRGVLAPLSVRPDPRLAVRPGVAYTADGHARLGVRPGKYVVFATRGFEYGLARRPIEVAEGQAPVVALELSREVDTSGFVACDTHVHTLTLSGHGDASIDERLVTLAGEGVELPVATEHNRLGDYAESAHRLGLAAALTPVIGDEVTTQRGHFNAFPFRRDETPPDASVEDWPKLFRGIRAGDDPRVIILNHPRDQHAGFRPFDPKNFNGASGELRPGVGFDAVEIINSGAMQSDPFRSVRDWFALWNQGQRVSAVGASDSHDVARHIVGQGRTYLACDDADPGHIDVRAAQQGLRDGRGVVSLGLLARLSVDDKFRPGDLATGLGETVRVTVSVHGPSWTRADRLELFANGVKVREQTIPDGSAAGEKGRAVWLLPRPRHDVALVAIASGPGVTAPYWPIPRPYQPSLKDWTPRVLSVTNPVRVDADGDGGWSSPRYYAQLAIELAGTEPSALFRFLERFDEAVATQAAALCHPTGGLERDPGFARALESAPEAVRRGFAAFEQTLSQP
ncbi:MAG: CehA/McbA family metallohydrolase [Isosphaeraceae bacterium]|nr:CehA/McbA family metallohydrolase [Isosphaeraceae bacterium]